MPESLIITGLEFDLAAIAEACDLMDGVECRVEPDEPDAAFGRTPARKTGRFKDSLGRNRCYEQGKQVKCATAEGETGEHREKGRAALAGLEGQAGQASAKQIKKAADALSSLTQEELRGLRRELGYAANRAVSPEALAAEAARRVAGRDLYARDARRRGVSPADMAERAKATRQVERERVTAAVACLREAKAALAKRAGKAITRGHPAFRAGGDYTQLTGFDVVARSLAGRFPEILGAHGYEHSRGHDEGESEAYQRLYELMAEGAPRLTAWGDAYRQAIDSLEAEGPRPKGREAKAVPAGDDDVPFAATDDAFDEELAELLADARVPEEGGLAEEDADFSADWRDEGPEDVWFAAEDWQNQPGPRSKRRWVNVKTGRVVYADANPGAGKRQPKAGATPRPGKGAPAQPKGSSDKPSRAAGAAAPKGKEAPAGDPVERAAADLKAMTAADLTPEKVKALAATLAKGMTRAQILALKDRLGVTGSGSSKSELAERVLARAREKLEKEKAADALAEKVSDRVAERLGARSPEAPEVTDAHRETLLKALDARGADEVHLADLAKDTGMDRRTLHATMDDLRRSGQLTATGAEGRHGRSQADLAHGKEEDGTLITRLSRKQAAPAEAPKPKAPDTPPPPPRPPQDMDSDQAAAWARQSPPGKRGGPDSPLRTTLKQVFEDLSLLVEYKRDRLVDLPTLYREARAKVPDLSPAEFKGEVKSWWEQHEGAGHEGRAELHIMNEQHALRPDQRALQIEAPDPGNPGETTPYFYIHLR